MNESPSLQDLDPMYVCTCMHMLMQRAPICLESSAVYKRQVSAVRLRGFQVGHRPRVHRVGHRESVEHGHRGAVAHR